MTTATPPSSRGTKRDGTLNTGDPVSIRDNAAALAWLDACVNVERTRPDRVAAGLMKLDRIRRVLDVMGNPQRDIRTLHIAGSKGKGSVTEMCASCLQACGYTVGIYTSPHLVDIGERIRINTDMIPKRAFTQHTRRVAEAAATLPKSLGQITFFEAVTAIALSYFADQAVDIAVIETGLGGRLDATNVVEPDVTAITSIQLEHTQLLGDTLEEIALEKAGILKPGIPVITLPQEPEVMAVLKDVAEQVGAPLQVLGEDIEYSCRFEASADLGPHARICLSTPRSVFEHFAVPLKGEHQAGNCGLALAMLDRLRERGMDTPEREVALGLARTPMNGRLEEVWSQPRILIDGAHNGESVRGLVRAIGAHIRYDSMVVIFGCAGDKDVSTMLREIARGADKIIFTQAQGNSRALSPQELKRRFAAESSKMAQTADTLKDAINIAARAVGRDDLICITGSFYLAGEGKKLLAEKRAAEARQQRETPCRAS